MAWENSNRKARLPADWNERRKPIIRRDQGKCQVVLPDGSKCLSPFSDVDHIKAGDDHSPENLRCICSWHHGKKSGGEGWAARHKKIQAAKKKFRRESKHPGRR